MLVRSVPIKIEINELIVDTFDLYKQGLQYCIENGRNLGIKNNVKLHPFVYSSLRQIGLPSQLAVSCIKMACGILKSKGRAPIVNNISIRYNSPRSFSFKDNVLSISTINGRVKIPFNIPEYALKYFKDWSIVESLLTQKKDKSYFTFTFSQENPIASNQHAEVLGVDLGVNKLAVTSQNNFYGKNIKQLRIKHDKKISQIQSKCTKSARRKLKKISGKWRRFIRLNNHEISKKIIDGLKSGDVVVLEDLSNIRITAKYNKWVHKWAFFELQSFIEYKAIAKGIRVVRVNPAYTSKTCNRCNSLNTRRHSGFFECLDCGFHCDCDLQASRNIAQRYMRNMCRASITTPHISTDERENSLSSRAIECEVRDKYPSL